MSCNSQKNVNNTSNGFPCSTPSSCSKTSYVKTFFNASGRFSINTVEHLFINPLKDTVFHFFIWPIKYASFKTHHLFTPFSHHEYFFEKKERIVKRGITKLIVPKYVKGNSINRYCYENGYFGGPLIVKHLRLQVEILLFRPMTYLINDGIGVPLKITSNITEGIVHGGFHAIDVVAMSTMDAIDHWSNSHKAKNAEKNFEHSLKKTEDFLQKYGPKKAPQPKSASQAGDKVEEKSNQIDEKTLLEDLPSTDNSQEHANVSDIAELLKNEMTKNKDDFEQRLKNLSTSLGMDNKKTKEIENFFVTSSKELEDMENFRKTCKEMTDEELKVKYDEQVKKASLSKEPVDDMCEKKDTLPSGTPLMNRKQYLKALSKLLAQREEESKAERKKYRSSEIHFVEMEQKISQNIVRMNGLLSQLKKQIKT